MAATIWADFKQYGKTQKSDEDWQAEALQALGAEDDMLPDGDEELLAAWDQVQGAQDGPDLGAGDDDRVPAVPLEARRAAAAEGTAGAVTAGRVLTKKTLPVLKGPAGASP